MELDYDRLDPELRPVIEMLPEALSNITRESVASVRAIMAAGPKPEAVPGVNVEKRIVPGRGAAAAEIPIVIYRQASDAPQPCLIWLHGGGYLFGSAEDGRAQNIARDLDCAVISVDYRMAPEHPFPAGTEDAYAVLGWAVAEAEALGIDPERLAIGGASAGGGLAAGLALMNRDRGGPALAFQLLVYPMIDNLHETPSGQITNHPVWNLGTSFNAWEMYLDGVPGKDASPYAAAARAQDLTGLPAAYICVGAEDLFRDEDIEYARRLMAAGVACELSVYPGLFHGAESFAPQAAVGQRLEKSFVHALGQALGLASAV